MQFMILYFRIIIDPIKKDSSTLWRLFYTLLGVKSFSSGTSDG